MPIPNNYLERVYAGVLGKIIGVYLGRPFEGWSHEAIAERLGPIESYVHDRLGVPLVVPDDDISGTFTFLRALEDYGSGRDVCAREIGQTWLNYIVENRTVLWWGGMGVSTEHTAFERLKSGIEAPQSGSIELNSRIVAEQIGAQIFIDGWGLIAPGDPELAAEFAARAGSVSHDGAAVHAAQVVAALVSTAFVESDIEQMLDTAVRFIPADGVIAHMIADIRSWRATAPNDWKATFARVRETYGYDRYGGGCHVVPNHALIVLALLHGGGDFSESLNIVNSCGWDTDCNSGNVGCILGVRNGLAGIDRTAQPVVAQGPAGVQRLLSVRLRSSFDWRGPVADRMYLPTADGGRCVTDAVGEAVRIANMGRALAGEPPIAPKGGARFHFELPGSVQGWTSISGVATIGNRTISGSGGRRSLAVSFITTSEQPARIATPTFVPPDALAMPGYGMVACPTLYPGQEVTANLIAGSGNARPVRATLFIQTCNDEEAPATTLGSSIELASGASGELRWRAPDTGAQPIARIGLELSAGSEDGSGALFVDYLTWSGVPTYDAVLGGPGAVRQRGFVDAVDRFEPLGPAGGMRIVKNSGPGLLIQGAREWSDYRLRARIACHLAESFGIAARVQGLKRYYALVLTRGNRVRLVKELDGATTLVQADFDWDFDREYALELIVRDSTISASIDQKAVFEVTDEIRPLAGGAMAALVETGNIDIRSLSVAPA
jgi:ADP-ribosylglycohydrolase